MSAGAIQDEQDALAAPAVTAHAWVPAGIHPAPATTSPAGAATTCPAGAATTCPAGASAGTPARRPPLGPRLLHIGLRLLPGILFLVFWQLASGWLVRAAYVSRPTAVAARLIDLFATGAIWPNLTVTAEELVLGYVLGAGSGLLCGYVLGRSPGVARVVEPYLMAFYGIPKIALAPLLVIWFGIGLWSKVVLAATLVFFLMFYSVFAAVRSVDRELVNLALVMGARESQLGRHVYLPAAMPAIMLGLRMAIPYAVIGVIAGEFVSSLHGIGLYISYASSTYDPAGVFAGITILLLFVLVANAVAVRVEQRVLRWRPESQSVRAGSP